MFFYLSMSAGIIEKSYCDLSASFSNTSFNETNYTNSYSCHTDTNSDITIMPLYMGFGLISLVYLVALALESFRK